MKRERLRIYQGDEEQEIKIKEEMQKLIEEELNKNDELTSSSIQTLLSSRSPDLQVSITTIKRTRKEMEWVYTRPHYCQLLHDVSFNACYNTFTPLIEGKCHCINKLM